MDRLISNLHDKTETGQLKGSKVFRSFSVFCPDAWPEDIVTCGEDQVDTLVRWYIEVLKKRRM